MRDIFPEKKRLIRYSNLDSLVPCLATVPWPSSMTSLDKVPWSSACLDSVTRPSACLDTVPWPSAMTCLGKVPLDLVHGWTRCLGLMHA